MMLSIHFLLTFMHIKRLKWHKYAIVQYIPILATAINSRKISEITQPAVSMPLST